MELGVTSRGDSLQLKGTYPPKCLGCPASDSNKPSGLVASTERSRSQKHSGQSLLVKSQVVGTFVLRLPKEDEVKEEPQQILSRPFPSFRSRRVLEPPVKFEDTPYRYPSKSKSPALDFGLDWSCKLPVQSRGTKGSWESGLWEPASSSLPEDEDSSMQTEQQLSLTLPMLQQRRRLLAAQRTRHKRLQPPVVKQEANSIKPATPGLYGQGIEVLQHYCAAKKRTQSHVAPPSKVEPSTRDRPHDELLQSTNNELRRKCVSLPSIHSTAASSESGVPSRKKSKGDLSLPELKVPDNKKKSVCEPTESQIRSSRSEPMMMPEVVNYNQLGSTSRPKPSKHYNLKDMTIQHHQRMVESQVAASDCNIKLWVDKIRDNNVVVDNNVYEMYARKPVSKYSMAKVNVTMALNNASNKNGKLKSMLEGIDVEKGQDLYDTGEDSDPQHQDLTSENIAGDLYGVNHCHYGNANEECIVDDDRHGVGNCESDTVIVQEALVNDTENKPQSAPCDIDRNLGHFRKNKSNAEVCDFEPHKQETGTGGGTGVDQSDWTLSDNEEDMNEDKDEENSELS